eukprot:810381-Alexandrium_andersonii.AAC.1
MLFGRDRPARTCITQDCAVCVALGHVQAPFGRSSAIGESRRHPRSHCQEQEAPREAPCTA